MARVDVYYKSMTTEIIQQVPRYEVNKTVSTSFTKFKRPVLNYKNLYLAQWLRGIASTLSKEDTFGAGTYCPSKGDVRLIESQIKGAEKSRDIS